MRIIGITGTNGAGKGAVVDYLKQKGFTHYSASGYISEELQRRGLELSRTNMRMVGNEFREKFGSGYLVTHFLEAAQESGVKDVAIESIRSTGEAQKLKDAGGILLGIDADRKIRYERIFKRKSGKDLIDFGTFVEQEEREWYGVEGSHDMNIRAVMDMADYTIENNGTIEELQIQIDAVLAKLER
jgi:dephospho-CoA kinase